MTNSPSISAGTHGGLSNWCLSTGGVYRRDGVTSRAESADPADADVDPAALPVRWSTREPPGLTRLLGVTRPPVLRFGGATGRQCRPAPARPGPATDSIDPDDRVGRSLPGVAARVLVLDSYDSFVFNLVQYLGELGAEPVVHRNDALDVAAALALAPDAVLLSPGPGRPEDAGIICAAVPAFAEDGDGALGVCLGHQAIGHVYGAAVVGAAELMHGKTSTIDHDGAGVFEGLPCPLTATRYHSLTLDPATVPEELVVTARTADGTVMGVRHRQLPVEGVQFHPESVLTAAGHDLLRNFLRQAGAPVR